MTPSTTKLESNMNVFLQILKVNPTFEEHGGKTLLVLHELYLWKGALEASLGGLDMAAEQFGQLDELLAARDAGGRR